jgi:hypothetical protein
MTVLCIEELTEGDLRILADHPRPRAVTASIVPTVEPVSRASQTERRDVSRHLMPLIPALDGVVS